MAHTIGACGWPTWGTLEGLDQHSRPSALGMRLYAPVRCGCVGDRQDGEGVQRWENDLGRGMSMPRYRGEDWQRIVRLDVEYPVRPPGHPRKGGAIVVCVLEDQVIE